jgi:3-oxoacyl-[acyl-carrier protein] reductase
LTRFSGRRVLVTGASRGLGADLARGFAAEGAHVLLGFRVQDRKAARVLADIEASGGFGELVQLDLNKPASLKPAQALRVDVLVNNAALTRAADFLMDDPGDFDEVVQVGLLGTARLTRGVARGMVAQGRGVILNIASVAALRAAPGQSAYTAAKAGLLGLSRALARELAPRGVRVNALIPGLLEVGMARRMPRDVHARWAETIPLGRTGRADEVTRAALWLCSDEASYVVGAELTVDGGMSL